MSGRTRPEAAQEASFLSDTLQLPAQCQQTGPWPAVLCKPEYGPRTHYLLMFREARSVTANSHRTVRSSPSFAVEAPGGRIPHPWDQVGAIQQPTGGRSGAGPEIPWPRDGRRGTPRREPAKASCLVGTADTLAIPATTIATRRLHPGGWACPHRVHASLRRAW